jgi:hypothetical protein
VGGGLGRSHGNEATYPRLADVIGFFKPEKLVEIVKAVLTIHRDFGDRTDRKHARLKYIVAERGADWTRTELEKRAGIKLEPARPFKFTSTGDLYGWRQAVDGKWFLTVFVETGRVKDVEGHRLKTALRLVAEKFPEIEFRLSANQNVILANIAETVHIASDWNLSALRFPVQWVNRPNNPTDPHLHDFRGLSGQLASGIVRKGQPVVVLPAGIKTTVKDIWTYDGSLEEAFCPQSVTLCLEHDIDVSRGDMIVGLENLPGQSSDLHAHVCWMHKRPLQAGKKYFLKHATQTVQTVVTQLESRINMATFEPEAAPAALAVNDVGIVRLKTAKPIVYDGYNTNRLTGSFILIEQGTNATVGAGMLLPPTEAVKTEYTDFAI